MVRGREAVEIPRILFLGDLHEVKGCVTDSREEEKQKVRSEVYGSKEPFSCLEERQMPWD